MKSWYTAEARLYSQCDQQLLAAHLVQTLDSLLEQNHVYVIVDSLEKQLGLEVDHLPLLGRLQGAHQGLEDVGATVIIEQDPKLDGGLTISILATESLDLLHQQTDFMIDVHCGALNSA